MSSQPLRGSIAFEWGPFAGLVVAVLAKQVFFGRVLQSYWPEQSFPSWASTHPGAFATMLGTTLVLFAPMALLGRGLRLALAIVVDVAVSVLMAADQVSLYFYGDVLSIASWTEAPMLSAAWRSVATAIGWREAFYFADAAVLLLMLPAWVSGRRRIADPPIHRRRVALGCLAAGLLLLAPAFRRAALDDGGGRAAINLQRDLCDSLGILPYHLFDVWRRPPVSTVPSDEELAVVERVLERRRRTLRTRSPLFGVAAGASLVLINAESLQAFPLGLVVAGQRVTPSLDAFAAESLRFVELFDETHLGTTSDAQLATLNSLHPYAIGYTEQETATHRFEALPAILAGRGYDTISMCGAEGTFWEMEDRHARYGFAVRLYEEAFATRRRVGPWLADRELLAEAAFRLGDARPPFFAFFLTSSNHHPFAVPARASDLVLMRPLAGTVLGEYLASVHYFDAAFGGFVDGLRASGALDRAVVALYGDHKAFLGDPPELAELVGFPRDSQLDFLLVEKRLPFLVRLPQGAHAGTVRGVGGHVDVAPTLLSLLGIDTRERSMLGRDLTAPGPGMAVFRDGGFVSDSLVFVDRLGPLEEALCYDRAGGRLTDPRRCAGGRAEALDRLTASDAILRGDLVGVRRPLTPTGTPAMLRAQRDER